MELSVHKIGDCLGGLSGHVAAGIVQRLFPQVLERVPEERGALQCCLDELGYELWDALKKERQY